MATARNAHVMRITKVFRFEAAHHLPNHAGKCRRPHGHSYQAEVTLEGPTSDEVGASDEGMVIDFGALSEAWSFVHAIVDHHDLNDVLPFDCQPTTAENVARYIASAMGVQVRRLIGDQHPARIVRVRVWETATGYAEWRR